MGTSMKHRASEEAGTCQWPVTQSKSRRLDTSDTVLRGGLAEAPQAEWRGRLVALAWAGPDSGALPGAHTPP